jgi:hypothetical protein
MHNPARAAATASVVPQPPVAAGKEVPPGVKGWSWGAFWLNWVWAIGNKTWIGLLAFVPLVNLVMPFVLGFKGREWAWRARRWNSVEHFHQVQRRWDIAGWVIVFAAAALLGTIAYLNQRSQMANFKVPDVFRANAEHQDAPVAAPDPAQSRAEPAPYPLPDLGFSTDSLLGELTAIGVDEVFRRNLEYYLTQPKRFWAECMESNASRAKQFGGMEHQEAQQYALDACRSETTSYHDCLNKQALEEAASCIKTIIDNQAQTED